MKPRKLRRSQTLAPFGVGAILDLVGESFVAEDITQWQLGATTPIPSRRLANLLRVDELRLPPVAPDRGTKGPGVPYMRFPQWLFCGTCRRMERWSWSREESGKVPTCPSCSGKKRQLVPMRFVMVCGNGHLDDVDWSGWAHRSGEDRNQKQCQKPILLFEQLGGVGGGLESLVVRCATCKAKKTLQGITNEKFRCRGRQPWQSPGNEPCSVKAVVVQRGASNVHFPSIISAIDIPPDSDWESWGAPEVELLNDPLFKGLLEREPDGFFDILVNQLCATHPMEREEVIAAWERHSGKKADESPAAVDDDSEAGLRREEWHAFLTPLAKEHPKNRFLTRHVALSDRQGTLAHPALDGLYPFLDRLVLVTRLREVRALRGFGRYDQQRVVAPDLGAGLKWLPAIETYGEGLFLTFAEEPLRRWEERPEVRQRAALLAKRLGETAYARWLPRPTARSLMLHTLAHLLIRQLTNEAGYSSASLRERVYAELAESGAMAGILVYTAAGDSEGTLGGLVRQGEPGRLIPALVVSLQQAQWCSLDPVCLESQGQGPWSLSLAACHACALVSETSCERGNLLLDRLLLVDPAIGFFGPILDALLHWGAEVTI